MAADKCRNCIHFKNSIKKIETTIGSSTVTINHKTAGEAVMKDKEGQGIKLENGGDKIVQYAVCQNADTREIQIQGGGCRAIMKLHSDDRPEESREETSEVIVYEDDYCSNFKKR